MKIGWFKLWRAARAVKAHARWEKEFLREFDKSDSKVHATVLLHARAMARGMVMRHFDDNGIRRCCFCISTQQLRKKVIESGGGKDHLGASVPKKRREVFACPDHWAAKLPSEIAAALAPGVGREPREASFPVEQLVKTPGKST